MQLLQTVPMWNVLHSPIDVEIKDAHVRNFRANTNGFSFSAIDRNENKEEQVFKAGYLILNVNRVGKRKRTKLLLNFVPSTPLTTKVYQDSLQSNQSCEKFIEERLTEKYLSLEMHPRSIASVLRMWVTKHYKFFPKETLDLFKKNFLLRRTIK